MLSYANMLRALVVLVIVAVAKYLGCFSPVAPREVDGLSNTYTRNHLLAPQTWSNPIFQNKIIKSNLGSCIDINDGTNPITYACAGTSNGGTGGKQWATSTGTGQISIADRCLTSRSERVSRGDALGLALCNDNDRLQKLRFDYDQGYLTFADKGGHLWCANVEGGSDKNGSRLVWWDCSRDAGNRFSLS